MYYVLYTSNKLQAARTMAKRVIEGCKGNLAHLAGQHVFHLQKSDTDPSKAAWLKVIDEELNKYSPEKLAEFQTAVRELQEMLQAFKDECRESKEREKDSDEKIRESTEKIRESTEKIRELTAGEEE